MQPLGVMSPRGILGFGLHICLDVRKDSHKLKTFILMHCHHMMEERIQRVWCCEKLGSAAPHHTSDDWERSHIESVPVGSVLLCSCKVAMHMSRYPTTFFSAGEGFSRVGGGEEAAWGTAEIALV